MKKHSCRDCRYNGMKEVHTFHRFANCEKNHSICTFMYILNLFPVYRKWNMCEGFEPIKRCSNCAHHITSHYIEEKGVYADTLIKDRHDADMCTCTKYCDKYFLREEWVQANDVFIVVSKRGKITVVPKDLFSR